MAAQYRLVSMPNDPVQKNLSATFQNTATPNQSISVHLNGTATTDSKAAVKEALQAAITALDAFGAHTAVPTADDTAAQPA